MRVAILGDGLLGKTIADLFDQTLAPGEYTLLTHRDIEITSKDSVKRVLGSGDFDAAINTVAMHRLMACEDDPMLARLVNHLGAEYVAETLPTVFVSSDYVFNDGGPHDEALPGETPRSVYGQTKLAGEMATLQHGGVVARLSGLYGHHVSHKGPTFPEVVISSFDPLKLPTDQRFSPTYAPDAALRIAYLALEIISGNPDIEGIYHVANMGSTSWAEFAEQILEVVPWKRHILPFEAHDRLRPKNSSLRSTRLPALPHWRLALDRWATVKRQDLYVSPKRTGS